MKTIVALVGCLVGLTMFTGCFSKSAVPPMDVRVTVAPNLCGDAYVTDVRCEKVGGSDFLTLQANLVSLCDDKPVAVDWRVQWLDESGIEIDSVVSSWNSVMLQPCELRGLKSTAPRADAADMRIYVRRANR